MDLWSVCFWWMKHVFCFYCEHVMNQILLVKGDIDMGLLGKAYFKDWIMQHVKGWSNAKKLANVMGCQLHLFVKLGKEKEYMNYNFNISISTIKI